MPSMPLITTPCSYASKNSSSSMTLSCAWSSSRLQWVITAGSMFLPSVTESAKSLNLSGSFGDQYLVVKAGFLDNHITHLVKICNMVTQMAVWLATVVFWMIPKVQILRPDFCIPKRGEMCCIRRQHQSNYNTGQTTAWLWWRFL